MARKDFLPKTGADFKDWSDNFVGGLQQQGNLLDPRKQQEAIDNCNILNAAYDNLQIQDAAHQRAIADFNAARDTCLPVLRDAINAVKKSPNYNEGVGRGLKIVTIAPQPTDWDNAKPNPKIKTLSHAVQITYTRGETDGVRVFCKRGGDADFKMIAHNTSSPFEDTRANLAGNRSEKREYYLVYVRKNKPTGQTSDIVIANVSLTITE